MQAVLYQAQRNYSAKETECLAVVWVIKKFREYHGGCHFKVVIDQRSLKWLRSLNDPTSRLARWSLSLFEYDFDIQYRKGSLNVIPFLNWKIENGLIIIRAMRSSISLSLIPDQSLSPYARRMMILKPVTKQSIAHFVEFHSDITSLVITAT